MTKLYGNDHGGGTVAARWRQHATGSKFLQTFVTLRGRGVLLSVPCSVPTTQWKEPHPCDGILAIETYSVTAQSLVEVDEPFKRKGMAVVQPQGEAAMVLLAIPCSMKPVLLSSVCISAVRQNVYNAVCVLLAKPQSSWKWEIGTLRDLCTQNWVS